MQIDLRLIEAFALVMRNGSLTRAEEVSGISKATLSRQIMSLEQTLGATLMTRRARGVVPTEPGRVFFAHCEEMLADLAGRIETARVQMQELDSGVTGTLNILADSVFSTAFVCHVTRLFRERYPNVECRMDIAWGGNLPDVSDMDCYVCAEPPDLPNVVAKLLGRISHGLYASPAYLQRRGIPVTPLDISRHDSIILGESQGASEKTMLHSDRHSQPYVPKCSVATNDYWVMKSFCLDGTGIALLPDFFARPEVTRRTLVPVLPNWKPERTRIYCAYQQQRYKTRKLKDFVDLMTTSVRHMDSYNQYVGFPSVLRTS
ncbi:DNA-binding transcriptional LysR family regulator [Pseudoduganella lurida]|uniref:DNA-binding transcriptional LysR family regulator n=1 Tax=Pseudoduganella lurida TaxID=1036180 RepID=A0A562R284_9BURK|nr:LysR family transcriptional regulator [Pseudoduganella lurida]TWI62570.1 DNA-binding transcriptional LysR family regulator [Pseudoduganella lurida]